MSEKYYSIINQIGEFLSIESANSSISKYLEKNFTSLEEKEKAARTVLDFILYFAPFRDILPLREIIYQTLLETLNRAKTLDQLNDLLLIDILLRIIEIYIINSQLTDKKKIISTLARSLLGLAPSALIINLCTIVKPIFSQSNYTNKSSRKMENMVNQDKKDEKDDYTVKQIKFKIENWIKSLALQSKDLSRIENLKKKVNQEVLKYAREFNLNEESDDFNRILREAQDMLDITLTAITLATDNKNSDLYSQLFPS